MLYSYKMGGHSIDRSWYSIPSEASYFERVVGHSASVLRSCSTVHAQDKWGAIRNSRRFHARAKSSWPHSKEQMRQTHQTWYQACSVDFAKSSEFRFLRLRAVCFGYINSPLLGTTSR